MELLREKYAATFGEGGDAFTNFKFVDGLEPNQRLKELKVFPVTEIVTYALFLGGVYSLRCCVSMRVL